MTAFFSLGLGSLKSMFQNKSHRTMLSGFLVAFCCLVITTNGNYLILFDRAVMQMDRCIIKRDKKCSICSDNVKKKK